MRKNTIKINKKVAFFIKFSAKGYSGGRIHALLMAEALSYCGYDIEIFCNTAPHFLEEFQEYTGHNRIKWFCKPNMDFSIVNDKFQWVVIVPNRSRGWAEYPFYLRAIKQAMVSNAKLMFLNFESVSWFNTVSRFKRDVGEWADCYRLVKYSDIILSSSKLGNSFAINDYGLLNKHVNFEYCYPSINSKTADKFLNEVKKKQIVIFSRWSDPHKNSNGILNLLCHELSGYEIIIVVGVGLVPSTFIDRIEKKATEFGISYSILKSISEHEKFEIISKSIVMVYLSEFEGFGLPPVESQYCNVPCICFDLPVLREVSGDSLNYVSKNDYGGVRNELILLLKASHNNINFDLHKKISKIADFKEYAIRLDNILKKHDDKHNNWFKSFLQNIFYFKDSFQCRLINLLKSDQKKRPINIEMLNEYIKLKWDVIGRELPTNKVVVYGSQEYCIWLYEITGALNCLDPVAVITDNDRECIDLWKKSSLSPKEFRSADYSAIILATECFQEEYSNQCRKLYGKEIKLINLYENLSSGPYPK